MKGLYRIEYIKIGQNYYRDYGYYMDLEEAKMLGNKLLDANKAKRVKITIIPVNYRKEAYL